MTFNFPAKFELDAAAADRQPFYPNIPVQCPGSSQDHICPHNHVQLAVCIFCHWNVHHIRSRLRHVVPGNVVRRYQVLRRQATS